MEPYLCIIIKFFFQKTDNCVVCGMTCKLPLTVNGLKIAFYLRLTGYQGINFRMASNVDHHIAAGVNTLHTHYIQPMSAFKVIFLGFAFVRLMLSEIAFTLPIKISPTLSHSSEIGR